MNQRIGDFASEFDALTSGIEQFRFAQEEEMEVLRGGLGRFGKKSGGRRFSLTIRSF